eukprot:CAMPEP_0175748166 /NCGR_PEP_ID=MMETSP0097-20121207/59479_1 /TAXON_ID=311494 /ORGANISM="Alexandrium monilatum, Strain CCMP3105" /LENGTH=51 /DNA_ID=CAMNT_0017056651 /DNA_START=92 /DNA_END=244 /DNA_ORIENTATION=+
MARDQSVNAPRFGGAGASDQWADGTTSPHCLRSFSGSSRLMLRGLGPVRAH